MFKRSSTNDDEWKNQQDSVHDKKPASQKFIPQLIISEGQTPLTSSQAGQAGLGYRKWTSNNCEIAQDRAELGGEQWQCIQLEECHTAPERLQRPNHDQTMSGSNCIFMLPPPKGTAVISNMTKAFQTYTWRKGGWVAWSKNNTTTQFFLYSAPSTEEHIRNIFQLNVLLISWSSPSVALKAFKQ